ncbi:hypothetical protein [Truepera radiovictrix]|uniref:Uncharacterized protein n=1 Tax=Truepera radiovictrix (strain DSM 17093 / CIP 108686 / LMG 22925 / RQ-24) TaxID=649638 RepID=D7CV19_TRURR|nr:hypothetical protein [Truepera radiovictrix]ADI15846.1 hypothetical protein Trad_2743 [Truepera radiovictrix DSM 17093]WMT58528.1 hypothetical protein RCV51_06175 [Truepera radiovictrix]
MDHDETSTDHVSGDRAEAARDVLGTPPQHLAAKDAVQDLLVEARKRGQGVAEQAAREVRGAAKTLQGRGAHALERGRGRLAERVGGLARALRRGSAQLRADSLPSLATFGDRIAEEAEAVERYLQGCNGEELLHDLQRFARERRSLFVGSLFLAGVAAARFMRSPGVTPQPGEAVGSRVVIRGGDPVGDAPDAPSREAQR